jgi:NAD(P)-dependent dehydrogenase (short-subunit alcohol dehydrogenase family)
MTTIAITGSASGIGAATAELLTSRGHRVVGIDLSPSADIVADLGVPEGRARVIAEVTSLTGGVLDGVVTCAGIIGLPGRRGSQMISINYFGSIDVLAGLRPLLARGTHPAAVVLSSNSATVQPGWPVELAHACLAGAEDEARALADSLDPLVVYPASKAALAWWTRQAAVTEGWAGSGIRLNAIAPGLIDTPMTAAVRRDAEVGPLLDQLPIPMGRAGRPEEVAEVIAFLLAPESSLLCGSVVFADGGTDALVRPRDWPAALKNASSLPRPPSRPRPSGRG